MLVRELLVCCAVRELVRVLVVTDGACSALQ